MFTATEHKSLWWLAGPIMVSNISVALLGMVDTAVVGHLDQPYYLGGVTLSMVVFNFLYWGLSFLRTGTTGIIAQHYGAQKTNHLRSSFFQAIVLALFISLIVLLMQRVISEFSFHILNGSQEVKDHARIYFNIAIWAAPATLLNLVVTACLLGMQRAGSTLLLAIFINVLNIILDIYFVIGLEWGVPGVAIATVVSQYCGLCLALYVHWKVFRLYPGKWQKALLFDINSILDMLSVNQNLFLRTICLLFVLAFFTHQSAGQGDDVLAANAILQNFYIFLALSLDGFATASEVMTGNAIGKKNHHQFWRAIKIANLWGLLFALLYTALFAVSGDWMISLMTSIESVSRIAHQHLLWMFLIPVVSVWCFIWDGVFIGARRAVEMRNSMLMSTLLVFLPAWYYLQQYGNHGLWLAFVLFLLFRSISMSFYAWQLEKAGRFV